MIFSRGKRRNEILRYKGITGVGKGKKVVRGMMTDQDSTIVFVERKLPKDKINPKEVIPHKVDGLQTDVIETGVIEPASVIHRKRYRPVVPGTSMAHIGGSACTAGIPVYKNGIVYSLSCVNLHCSTEFMEDPKLEVPMIQPSPWDGGKPSDVVGKTMGRYEFSFDKENLMDTALVAMDTILERKTPEKGGYSGLTAKLRAGETVHKEGRTSGYTEGRILATDVTALVRYPMKDGSRKVARFTGQVFTEAKLIFGGDSSSAVFNANRDVVGQVYAGSEHVGVITPIDTILDYFGVSINQPLEGWIAAGQWTEFDRLNITIKADGARLRSEPSIGDNIITSLGRGTRVSILDHTEKNDGYIWIRVSVL